MHSGYSTVVSSRGGSYGWLDDRKRVSSEESISVGEAFVKSGVGEMVQEESEASDRGTL